MNCFRFVVVFNDFVCWQLDYIFIFLFVFCYNLVIILTKYLFNSYLLIQIFKINIHYIILFKSNSTHHNHTTSRQEFHDEVEIGAVLEGIEHLHHPFMRGLYQNIPFCSHVRYLCVFVCVCVGGGCSVCLCVLICKKNMSYNYFINSDKNQNKISFD